MTIKEAIGQLEFLRHFVFDNDRDALDIAIQVLKWWEQETENGAVKGMSE